MTAVTDRTGASEAPTPTPAELAVIERFGIFEAEETVERVARAIRREWVGRLGWPDDWDDADETTRDHYRRLAAAAIAAMPASRATCGDLSPAINFGGDPDGERQMCDLPVDHGGAHQHSYGDGLPPMRWIVRDAALAAMPVRPDVTRAMLDVADNLDYYASRTTGGTHASGLEDAAAQIRAAVGATPASRAEEALRRVEALAREYALTELPPDYGSVIAAEIRAALAAPLAGQHTTDGETDRG